MYGSFWNLANDCFQWKRDCCRVQAFAVALSQARERCGVALCAAALGTDSGGMRRVIAGGTGEDGDG
jgi:hypothetical protein